MFSEKLDWPPRKLSILPQLFPATDCRLPPPMDFIEEGASNHDSCCMKELKDRHRAAVLLAKLEKHDPTRRAVEKRLHALNASNTYSLTSAQRDPGLQQRFQRQFAARETCCTTHHATAQANEDSDTNDLSETDSNLSDDLDDFMTSFNEEEHARALEKEQESQQIEKDEAEAYGLSSYDHYNNYNSTTTNSTTSPTAASASASTSTSTSSATTATALPQPITLEELQPTQWNDAVAQRPHAVFLLVPSFDGTSTLDLYLDGIAQHLSFLSCTYDLTSFCLLRQPQEKDCRRYGVDRVPALVCCLNGSVVARATRLEQFAGRDSSGGSDVGERLDPWLEQCRMIGTARQSPESMLLQAMYQKGKGKQGSAGGDHDHDDEDLMAVQNSCGKEGCCKTFHHTHIDFGMSINAEDLNVL
jgi:hypothetical protein